MSLTRTVRSRPGRRLVAAVLSIALIVLAAGCAGRNFTRAETESLVLGKTTESEIRQRFGDPYREGTAVKNAETMKTLVYAYASGAASLAGGVTPSRGQGFYFWNGTLVGHDFTSSFDEDKTDFDQAKAQQIKQGETTEAQVLALLGKPQGAYTYPLIKDRGARAIVYQYAQTRGSAFDLKHYQQLLVVTLGADGVVKDAEFTSSGQK
jgi:outer membrane protein assembly factor BamE (lipoprotein component of BamABCDE complex)